MKITKLQAASVTFVLIGSIFAAQAGVFDTILGLEEPEPTCDQSTTNQNFGYGYSFGPSKPSGYGYGVSSSPGGFGYGYGYGYSYGSGMSSGSGPYGYGYASPDCEPFHEQNDGQLEAGILVTAPFLDGLVVDRDLVSSNGEAFVPVAGQLRSHIIAAAEVVDTLTEINCPSAAYDPENVCLSYEEGNTGQSAYFEIGEGPSTVQAGAQCEPGIWLKGTVAGFAPGGTFQAFCTPPGTALGTLSVSIEHVDQPWYKDVVDWFADIEFDYAFSASAQPLPDPLPEPIPSIIVDSDNDGFPDLIDQCPATPGDAPLGCPPASDTDGDGVDDANDNCPFVPNASQTNTDKDTQGDACDTDDDNDQVQDIIDLCPLQPGVTPHGCADADGDLFPDNGVDQCPTEAGPQAGCPIQEVILGTVGVDITYTGKAKLGTTYKGVDPNADKVLDNELVFTNGNICEEKATNAPNPGLANNNLWGCANWGLEGSLSDTTGGTDGLRALDADGRVILPNGVYEIDACYDNNELIVPDQIFGDFCNEDTPGDRPDGQPRNTPHQFAVWLSAHAAQIPVLTYAGPGEPVSLHVDVANIGAGLDGYEIVVDNGAVLDSGTINTLAAGAVSTGNAFTFTPPGTLAPGSIYPFTVTISSIQFPDETVDIPISIKLGGTDTDGDGLVDAVDNCPLVKNSNQADLDGDKIGDVCDSDEDGDGVANSLDAFPRCDRATTDTDADGKADRLVAGNGACAAVPANDDDDDNDGTKDSSDDFHLCDRATTDTDNDGDADELVIGSGVCASVPTEDTDDDNDGVADGFDDDDNDPTIGTLGATDCSKHAGTLANDPDGDGCPNSMDSDKDGDGVINANDDDDNDATADSADPKTVECELHAPTLADPDPDGDGCPNSVDTEDRQPDAVTALVVKKTTPGEVTLEWTAPSDDGDAADPVSDYEVRHAATAIVTQADWIAATAVAPANLAFTPYPLAVTPATQTVVVNGLAGSTTYHFSVRAIDDATPTPRLGDLATSVSATTQPPGMPTLSTITPNTGGSNGGTSVTLTGSNFQGPATVYIGGIAATNVVVVSSTSITAETGVINFASVGPKDVTITNSGGLSDSLIAAYTYTLDPAPGITSIAPANGALAGGTSITISGANFVAGATVDVGGIPATAVVVTNPSQITAAVPAGVAHGFVDVVVTNPDGQLDTQVNGFEYTAGAATPVVTSISPKNGPPAGNTLVTIKGTNLNVNQVVFGTKVVAPEPGATSTEVKVLTPRHAPGNVPVTVYNVGGLSAKAPSNFQYFATGGGGPGLVDSDGDGRTDANDNCPLVFNQDQNDMDSDGIGDVCDSDRDGDGVNNNLDAFPDDKTETADSDNDGVGDNADKCSKGDDAADYDSDDTADACDADDDNDTINDKGPVGSVDQDDNCPQGPLGWVSNPAEDYDQDGCRDADEDTDDDGDGIPDTRDACPMGVIGRAPSLTSAERQSAAGDFDGDGCKNSEDNDDDGDGVPDSSDAFPYNAGEDKDSDGDGRGDNSDNCPDDKNVGQLDTDGDGIGDRCDPVDDLALDVDGDGLIGYFEIELGTDPNEADSDGDGFADGVEAAKGSDPLNSNDVPGDPIVNDGGPVTTDATPGMSLGEWPFWAGLGLMLSCLGVMLVNLVAFVRRTPASS